MGAIISALARFFGLGGLIKSAIGGIFGAVSSGIQTYIKWLVRILLFSAFSTIVVWTINFFTSKITNYSLDGIDSCTAYVIGQFGIFPALSAFLKIIAIGFLAKHMITYWRETV